MSRSSFKNLVEEFQIEIPLIQRDYAQGRVEEENKAGKFLDAILKGMNSSNGLNLDFIYGSTIEKDSLKKFTPLDGQQRLTTLFLIYFYLSLKDNQNMIELSRFTYEVRSSSTDFIEALVKASTAEGEEKLKLPNLRHNIENSNWFFLSWNNDPTVKSILNMLSLIEEKFINANFLELEKITFDKLPLHEFNLTDELYVKMNSRGKPLSDFENFKSEFEIVIEERFKNDLEKELLFKRNLDNAWLDIFWKNSNFKPTVTDKQYFNFFNNLTLFFALNSIESLDDFDLFEYNYSNEDIDKINIIFHELTSYDEKEIHVIRNLNIFGNFTQSYIKAGKSGITYEDRVIFYALMQFFFKIGSVKENINLFTSWMRVSLNLINNIAFDKMEQFKNAIEIIDKLSMDIENIYEQLDKIQLQKPSSQYKEEKLKAEIILNNPNEDWEKEFILAEKHWYLDGEVGFLIKFSNNDINKFIHYRDKFIALFDKRKLYINEKDNLEYQTLIHRALLSFENEKNNLGYLKLTKRKNSDRYTFCVYDERLRIKNENWRRVFSSKYFQNLLDILNENVEDSLKDKIDNYIFDCKDFKSYLINPKKSWEVISFIRNYQIEWKNNQEVFLNRGGTAVDKWGWHRVAELYSYYLYKKDFEDKVIPSFSNPWYWNISDENPSIVLDGYKKYAINIYYKNGFNIMFYNSGNDGKISQDIIDDLEKSNFILDGKRYYLRDINLCEIDKVFNIVSNIFDRKNLSNDII